MDIAFSLLNALACGLISLALIGAVLSPRVHDGIIIKVGLVSMALGFGACALRLLDGSAAGDGQALGRCLLLINSGIAVVVIGFLVRKLRGGHALRRSTDWAELDDTQQLTRGASWK